MSTETYIGVGRVARKVNNIYVGVDGVAKKVTKGYIGVNGVARQIYSALPQIEYKWNVYSTKPNYVEAGRSSTLEEITITSYSSRYIFSEYGGTYRLDDPTTDFGIFSRVGSYVTDGEFVYYAASRVSGKKYNCYKLLAAPTGKYYRSSWIGEVTSYNIAAYPNDNFQLDIEDNVVKWYRGYYNWYQYNYYEGVYYTQEQEAPESLSNTVTINVDDIPLMSKSYTFNTYDGMYTLSYPYKLGPGSDSGDYYYVEGQSLDIITSDSMTHIDNVTINYQADPLTATVLAGTNLTHYYTTMHDGILKQNLISNNIYSPNSNTYPDDGIQDGYWYVKQT